MCICHCIGDLCCRVVAPGMAVHSTCVVVKGLQCINLVSFPFSDAQLCDRFSQTDDRSGKTHTLRTRSGGTPNSSYWLEMY